MYVYVIYVMYLFIAAPCTADKEVEQLEGLGGKRLEGLGGKRGQVSRAGGTGAGEGSVKKSRRSEREVHHEVLPPLASICFIYQNKTYQTVFSREIRRKMCSGCDSRPSRAYLETLTSSETHKLTPETHKLTPVTYFLMSGGDGDWR